MMNGIAPRPAFRPSAAFRKKSDVIANEMKYWIAKSNLQAGDRLPQEKELIRLFGVSRATIREALGALEVQGLVRITTGPKGGAAVSEVPEATAMDLLGSFFYFQQISVQDIYQVRREIEPTMAVAAVGHLSGDHFARLQHILDKVEFDNNTPEKIWESRKQEIAFHDIIAEACPNRWLSFCCRFMNKLLLDIIVIKKIYEREYDEFSRHNQDYHDQLMKSFRLEDREAIRRIMHDHMNQAACHMEVLADDVNNMNLLTR
jgi:GntR family transcriptional repressor for pyruvate dehydrogenase complex